MVDVTVADDDSDSGRDITGTKTSADSSVLLYKVYDRPAWYTALLLGIQVLYPKSKARRGFTISEQPNRCVSFYSTASFPLVD